MTFTALEDISSFNYSQTMNHDRLQAFVIASTASFFDIKTSSKPSKAVEPNKASSV